MSLQIVNWGSGDAKQEYNEDAHLFNRRLIETGEKNLIDIAHHLFLWAPRGCGKSAISIGEKKKANKEDILVEIDFEQREAWTQALITRVSSIFRNETHQASFIASQLWTEAIWVEIMQSLKKKRQLSLFKGKDTITRYLKKTDRNKSEDVFQHLIQNYDTCFNALEKQDAFVLDPYTKLLQLSVTGLKILENNLTKTTEFSNAKKAAIQSIPENGKIVILVDSVDKWLPPYKHSTAKKEFELLCDVLRALARALQDIFQDTEIKDRIRIKALFPLDEKELVVDRTYQHARIYHHDFSWSASDLSKFILKRLRTGLPTEEFRTAGRDELKLWEKLFGSHVRNKKTKGMHTSLDYVLRHTLNRPRQVLMFCRLASEVANQFNTDTLNQESVREIARRHCADQYQAFVREFSYLYPPLDKTLNLFRHFPNLFKRDKEFYDRIKNAELSNGMKNIDDLLEFLFLIGFIGIHKTIPKNEFDERKGYMRTLKSNETHLFLFSHQDKSLQVKHEESLCIHPMFYDTIDPLINRELTVGENII